MEADLLRFYGVDLRDLWRGGLTLRRLDVLVRHLPPEAATWAALNGLPAGWTMTDVLLTDLYQALTGSEHPARPKPQKDAPGRAASLHARLTAQRERLGAPTPEG